MATGSRQFIYQPFQEEVRQHFHSIPWAQKLFDDPSLQPFTNESRIVKPTNTGDTFMSQTLATEDTIAAWQSFHKTPSPGSPRPETITVIKIGSGVNGHVDICHGGFVSLLLDEVIGTAVQNPRPLNKTIMTAYLNVDYKQPVPTPGVVLCRAWVEKREGRKIFGRGTVEDGEGGVMASGEGLFIATEKIAGKGKL